MNSRALADKVALITGSTRGIGLGVAQAFLACGARVMVSGRTEESLCGVAAHLGDASRWSAVASDLGAPDAPALVVQATLKKFGQVDVLVNNAGMSGELGVWDTSVEEWDRVNTVNLRASFFCARAAAGVMKAGSGGSIINMSSVAAQIGGAATGPAYVASKAGLIGLTRSLARHFAPSGVRVNCIAPADIDTDMTAGWSETLRARLIGMTPLARFGRVSEIAATAVFLASDDASYMTGQVLNVNGGMYMG